MENQAAKCCLVLLAVCFICLSYCKAQTPSDFRSVNMLPSKILDSTHHSIEKRPTVLLNRLMYALQNAIQPSDERTSQRKSQSELERRGYPKHYWKCYFNAVTCFRRKRQVSTRSNRL